MRLWRSLLYSDSFFLVACDRRGTHSLQSLIARSTVSQEELELIMDCCASRVVALAPDIHATHVLQQIVECVVSRSAVLDGVLLDEVVLHLKTLASNQYALGLVKRCITYAETRGYTSKLGAKLEQYLPVLVEDPYGNYAIQHALETWGRRGGEGWSSAKRMVQRISDKIVQYAMHKFASNVAEMAIKVAEPQMKWKLISQFTIVRGTSTETEFFANLIKSPFAVFVVATALRAAQDPQQAGLMAGKFLEHLSEASSVKNRTRWEKTLAPYVIMKQQTTLSYENVQNYPNTHNMWLPPGLAN